jgi:hypothetical protein
VLVRLNNLTASEMNLLRPFIGPAMQQLSRAFAMLFSCLYWAWFVRFAGSDLVHIRFDKIASGHVAE